MEGEGVGLLFPRGEMPGRCAGSSDTIRYMSAVSAASDTCFLSKVGGLVGANIPAFAAPRPTVRVARAIVALCRREYIVRCRTC